LKNNTKIYIIEPFYGGSHQQLIDLLKEELLSVGEVEIFTLPAKKWKWRLRCSSMYFADIIPVDNLNLYTKRVLFCTSMLNLTELLALRPDLLQFNKFLYFHENQLTYPSRYEKERDFQFGWNQIISAISADQILFNSNFNMESFISNIDQFTKKGVPKDQRPRTGIFTEKIRKKSRVLYFPIKFDKDFLRTKSFNQKKFGPIHILWNHRWEYDKRPDLFFSALYKLQEVRLNFKVSVVGQCFEELPQVFQEAKEKLKENIYKWGFLKEKEEYYKLLEESDIVVSTTDHEFLGISIIEAISFGCYPICPNRLVFPEYIPTRFLYNTNEQVQFPPPIL